MYQLGLQMLWHGREWGSEAKGGGGEGGGGLQEFISQRIGDGSRRSGEVCKSVSDRDLIQNCTSSADAKSLSSEMRLMLR
jgi:hypothetical protein